MRRCTGLRPSRTSGRARDTMTDIEYSRKERSISSWISIGSMNPMTGMSPLGALPLVPPVPVDVSVPRRRAMWCSAASDVEEADVLRVGLDEVPPQFHVVTHQHRALVVGEGRLLHADLEEGALGRVDGGLAQLGEVHLPQALQPLEVLLVVRVLDHERVLGRLVLQVDLLL